MKTQEVPMPAKSAFSLKRILVPVDFSPLSKKALQYAQRFAKEFNAEISLVHVLEPEIPPVFDGFMIPRSGPNFCAATQEKKELKALAQSARAGGVEHVTSRIRRGLASYEIVDAARDLDVDLIIMATHGYTGWKHFCIGSTAERVVRAAACPVLVVREKEHEFVTAAAHDAIVDLVPFSAAL